MSRPVRAALLAAEVTSAALGFSVPAQAQSDPAYQAINWSLGPMQAPFPCRAVSFDGAQVVFKQPFNVFCGGQLKIDLPAGSIMGINAVCNGTTAILFHGSDVATNYEKTLFGILSKQCLQRMDRRRR